jgi:7-carboxy-7-deazaguanine synthase
VFVRLAGCHLRCVYCDTEYAFKDGRTMTVDEVRAEVETHPTRLVEITGGEPLLQPRMHGLVSALCDRGWTVLIETSGACDITACDPRAIRIVDLKTPGSGEEHRNLASNLDALTGRDEVKFVVMDRADYVWARRTIAEHDLVARCAAVLLSPVFEQAPGEEIAGAAGLPLADLASWILEDGLDVRLQPQLHKFIWDPQARGV